MSSGVVFGIPALCFLVMLTLRVLIARDIVAAATRTIGMADTSPEVTFAGDPWPRTTALG